MNANISNDIWLTWGPTITVHTNEVVFIVSELEIRGRLNLSAYDTEKGFIVHPNSVNQLKC